MGGNTVVANVTDREACVIGLIDAIEVGSGPNELETRQKEQM